MNYVCLFNLTLIALTSIDYQLLQLSQTHQLAKIQMKGFGAMLSFELSKEYDTVLFLKSLQLIKPSMSLAGVESTMILPALTSHALLSESDRLAQGISSQLIRFSLGIESKKDLIHDIERAIDCSNQK